MTKKQGFTLIEIMVVILIVSILAAAAIPLMRGKVDRSKWTEANAAAGMIRNAVAVYFVETGNTLTGDLDDAGVLQDLNIQTADLEGTYFTAGDYAITSVNASGIATVTATGSKENAPSGSKTLASDGTWE